MKIRFLTAQRGGEVIKMRWRDLDLDAGWWTIPGEHAKNGRAHRVPLVPEAIAIIKAQQKDKQEQKKGTRGVDQTREQGLRLRRNRRFRPGPIEKGAFSNRTRALKIEFRGHDLRRTAATKMAEAGVPRDHIAKVLNHVEGGPAATRVYDRYGYNAEKRSALDQWARRLAGIVEGKAAKVTPIRQRAAAR